MKVEETLAERAKVYGSFRDLSDTAQSLKDVMASTSGYSRLSNVHMEALDLIATKIARILTGDPYHEDSWLDIAGYATLAKDNRE